MNSRTFLRLAGAAQQKKPPRFAQPTELFTTVPYNPRMHRLLKGATVIPDHMQVLILVPPFVTMSGEYDKEYQAIVIADSELRVRANR